MTPSTLYVIDLQAFAFGISETSLLDDLSHLSCTYGTATFADREFQTFFHSDRLDQFYGHLGVITRHDHFCSGCQFYLSGHVCGTEVELRTVFVEEWSVTSTLFFAQYVHISFELGVRSDRTGFYDNHTAADLCFLETAQQQTGVVSSFSLIEELAEHFNTGNG